MESALLVEFVLDLPLFVDLTVDKLYDIEFEARFSSDELFEKEFLSKFDLPLLVLYESVSADDSDFELLFDWLVVFDFDQLVSDVSKLVFVVLPPPPPPTLNPKNPKPSLAFQFDSFAVELVLL